MAPRPNWKGYLKLSLVSCAVALYPATSERERVSFNQLNKNTGNRIRYKKVDAETQEEVGNEDIIKGYQVDKDVYVTVEDAEIEALQVEATHTIEIDSFVPFTQIDARYFDAPYYIIPNDKVGQDAFAVIREAMRARKVVGIGRVVIAKRERPIILEPSGKGLRGMTLRYPYEVRDEKEYFGEIADVKVAPDMLKLAEHIVDTKAGDFEPTAFVDHYEEAVVDLLKSKQAGRAVPKGRAAAPPSNVINLMDALKRSISSEKEAAKDTAKAQKSKTKKADDLRKQPQFKFPIEGGGPAKQGKAAAKAGAQAKPAPAAKSKRKSA
jgi:DNA end-binding protein Ku